MNQEQIIKTYQPVLQAIALKMLKCRADAEDLVQDTFMKWLSVDQEKVQNTKAYLIGAITNTCLNHISSLKRKKEEYFDSFQWPDFKHWFAAPDFGHLDKETEVSAAFSLLLSKLEPLERAVFLLREVFNLEYDEVQRIIGKKQEYCRQLLCRAHKKLKAETGKLSTAVSAKRELFADFIKACNLGEIDDFVAALKKDISPAFS